MLLHLNFSKVRNDNNEKKNIIFFLGLCKRYFFTYLWNFCSKNGYHVRIFIMHPFESHFFFPLYGWNPTLDGHDLNFNLCLVWFLVKPLACLQLDKKKNPCHSQSWPKMNSSLYFYFINRLEFPWLQSLLLRFATFPWMMPCLVTIKAQLFELSNLIFLGITSFWKPPLN